LNLLHQISDPLPPAAADPAVAAVVVFVVVTVFVILKILFTI
jgi:hypothetical protein